ncbi:hypothetical protein C7271_24130, partial [filamentous cyanobacterium CCP5]
MKKIQLSNKQAIIGLAAGFSLAIGVGGGLRLWLAGDQEVSTTARTPEMPEADRSAAADPQAESFEKPFLNVGQGLRLAQPVLLQSTPTEERVIAVVAGRTNPFAPITRPGSTTASRGSQPADGSPA